MLYNVYKNGELILKSSTPEQVQAKLRISNDTKRNIATYANNRIEYKGKYIFEVADLVKEDNRKTKVPEKVIKGLDEAFECAKLINDGKAIITNSRKKVKYPKYTKVWVKNV
jgi:hypothetical protein